ncbi:hypothetical protein MLD38_019295 [Melastoma candidum]|uniref:Uncharacterized protein n=1 Tax=Melastoma candidum TaxID=119954 RepID=A0ACB9QZM9_9MYRT|nr:hypothetical protein MLD38_019295 [Melastoma candidum]
MLVLLNAVREQRKLKDWFDRNPSPSNPVSCYPKLALAESVIFLLLWEFSILDQSRYSDEALSEERANELFLRWKEKHGKVYVDSHEEEERFYKFKDNQRYMLERKACTKRSGKCHAVGLNKFVDLSNAEFQKAYLS